MALITDLLSPDSAPHLWATWLLLSLVIFSIVTYTTFSDSGDDPSKQVEGRRPPWIPEKIPYFSNAYAYIFHNLDFLNRAKSLPPSPLSTFRLGPKTIHLARGPKTIQSVFRNTTQLTSDSLFLMAIRQIHSVSPSDADKFGRDKSGRGHTANGDGIGEENRMWAPHHRMFVEYMNPQAVGVLTGKYCLFFGDTLSRIGTGTATENGKGMGEWQSVVFYEWLKTNMATAAISAMSGTEILRLNPGFVDAMWDFDECVLSLLYGVPRWAYRGGYEKRDRYHEMGERWLEAAEREERVERWKGEDGEEKEWDEVFGARFTREHFRFFRGKAFGIRSRAGFHVGTIWALNANTTPLVAWAMIEIMKDPKLLEDIRAESEPSFESDEEGNRKLNTKKLAESPLLQSVYVEMLRMHVSINVSREALEDLNMEGYKVKKGHLVSMPSYLGHTDQEVWAASGHPASEFWAQRHISYVEEKDENGDMKLVPQFSMSGKGGSFFPFNGGVNICPGRHFAKLEIMATIALIVCNFDLEFEELVMMDGTKSDREPRDDPWFCGTASMPPDRDMRIRWRRR